MSSTNLAKIDKILPRESATLNPTMRRRAEPRDILARRMKATGLNPPSIARRAAEQGAEVSDATIKAILRGESRNAGIFTWHAIALGMDIPPLELYAELVGESLTDSQVSNGQLGVLQELLKDLSGTKRAKAEIFLEGFLHNLQRLKG